MSNPFVRKDQLYQNMKIFKNEKNRITKKRIHIRVRFEVWLFQKNLICCDFFFLLFSFLLIRFPFVTGPSRIKISIDKNLTNLGQLGWPKLVKKVTDQSSLLSKWNRLFRQKWILNFHKIPKEHKERFADRGILERFHQKKNLLRRDSGGKNLTFLCQERQTENRSRL